MFKRLPRRVPTSVKEIKESLPFKMFDLTDDERLMVRQEMGMRVANLALAVPEKKCIHGKPQVYMMAPVNYMPSNTLLEREKAAQERSQSQSLSGKIDPEADVFHAEVHTGGPYLRCPLLEMRITELEHNGGLDEYIESVRGDKALQERLKHMHEETGKQRWALMPSEKWRNVLHEDVKRRFLMSVGLCGIRQVDHIKCLHAHVGDYLMRGDEGGGSPVGKIVLQRLEAEGFPVNGRPDCARLCDTQSRTQVWRLARNKRTGRLSLKSSSVNDDTPSFTENNK